MHDLDKNQDHAPTLAQLLGAEATVLPVDLADVAAMQPDHPEVSLAPRIVLVTLGFMALLHTFGYFYVPNYASFMRMHLFSMSVACLSFAILTAVHLYSVRVRSAR